MSTALGGTNNASLWNNPQILSALLPGVNLQAMQQAMQAQLNVDAIPLSNMSQEMSGLQSQVSAWQGIQTDLNNLLTDANSLAGTSLYQGVTATSSNTTDLTASGGGSGVPGTYQVSVGQLAQIEIDNSAAQASASSALGATGSFSINGQSVSVSSSDSLQTIANNINAAGAGVTATLLPESASGTTGYVLSIASTEGQAITWSDPNGILQNLGVLGSAGTPADQQQAAQAATYTINGVQEQSATNSDSTSIPGVTLGFNAPTSSSATVTVSQDQQGVTSAFGQLATDFNTLLGDINKYAGKGGVLEGNATLLGISDTMQQVLGSLNSSLPGGYQALAQMGVTTSAPVGSPDQLTMSVDTATLQQALNGNAADVALLLNGAGTGIATQLVAQLNALVGTTGSIPTNISSLQQQISTLSSTINDPNSPANEIISQQEQSLQTQFQNMITALMTSQSQGQQISGFLQAQYGTTTSSTQSGSSGVL